MRLVSSKNRTIQKYLETLSRYSILVQFEVSLTACRVHWESECMKTKDQLYQRESVILRPEPEATRMSISTVKLQYARRQHNVTKLIEMFEKNIGIRNNSLKTWVKSRRINRFSEKSQKLLEDINRTEIFELCENSAKLQCLDCNSFTEIGIIYCSCGRNFKYKQSPTTTQKANCDYTSIPGFVIKKNSSRGPKHGQSERQIMFFKTKEMLKKARQEKHGSHPTKLSRWYEQEGYRRSWAEHNIGEKEIMALRSHRPWNTWLHSYTSWTDTERQTLGSSFEWRWAQRSLRTSDTNLPIH